MQNKIDGSRTWILQRNYPFACWGLSLTKALYTVSHARIQREGVGSGPTPKFLEFFKKNPLFQSILYAFLCIHNENCLVVLTPTPGKSAGPHLMKKWQDPTEKNGWILSRTLFMGRLEHTARYSYKHGLFPLPSPERYYKYKPAWKVGGQIMVNCWGFCMNIILKINKE